MKKTILFKQLTLSAALTLTMALPSQQQQIHQHPNGYIKSTGRQFNVPKRCYIDADNIERIDVCGSLKLKQEAAEIIQHIYKEDEMEDWLWYLFLETKYKTLAQVFAGASGPQQVELFFRFIRQLIHDCETKKKQK